MSSDRLSFNRSADGEDDGARWEAYLALLRRTGASLPSSEKAEDEVAEDRDPLAERGFTAPPDTVEASEASGATVAPAAQAAGSLRRGSRLVVWAVAAAAGIILAALLVSRQQDRRDIRTQIQPTLSRALPGQSSHDGWVGRAVGAAVPIAPPPIATPPATARTVVPTRLAPAPSLRPPQPVSHQARHQSPQCWTAIPSPDHRDGEVRLMDCPSFSPPPERTSTTLVWQATP